jgi:hypothetical protein
MPPEIICRCSLCATEARLLKQFDLENDQALGKLASITSGLNGFSSVSSLLSHLRELRADTRSDEILRELFAARAADPQMAEALLVLAFLPMLHITIRRVAQYQPTLLSEDITQQTLSILLQFLRSDELLARSSHLAFAISRAVKRRVFKWASRESGRNRAATHGTCDVLSSLAADDPFERHVLLRHFLHRCVTRGLLTDAELDLLIQFKLDENSGEDRHRPSGNSSNAVRQKLKRLLRKLRRLASCHKGSAA